MFLKRLINLVLNNTMEVKIGTHNGRFHCDEVLACTMLRKYTQKFKQAKVIRTRDPQILKTCDIVVDVGGKYQPPFLLDHHQIEFQGTYPNYEVRLSSAGLVYMHYPEVVTNIVNKILENDKPKLTFEPFVNEQVIKQIRQKIYKNFIIYVDANDNGIDKINEKDVSSIPTTLWARVSKLNPMWWDQSSNEDDLFNQAMNIVEQQLYSQIRQTLLGSMQTKSIVKSAFDERFKVHQSGKIVKLSKYVPWQKAVVQLEQQNKCEGQILYVVFPQKSGQKWRIQSVSLKQGSFELRKGLKQPWRGIKDMPKLIEVSGIKDIDFVHASGFIGGAKSLESAIKMGQLSL